MENNIDLKIDPEVSKFLYYRIEEELEEARRDLEKT